MVREIQARDAGFVIVDSFRTLVPTGREPDPTGFLHQLALQLTAVEATTFLIGEYSPEEMAANPLFGIADGVLSLSQNRVRNSMVRKLRIHKMRGQDSQPGRGSFRGQLGHHRGPDWLGEDDGGPAIHRRGGGTSGARGA